MRTRFQHGYFYGPHRARTFMGASDLTLPELAGELDTDSEVLSLNPWRRSGRAAIRRVLGH